MPRKNPHGDLVLTDPEVLRLVAEPTRYALLTRLQRGGAATPAVLTSELGIAGSRVESDLRVLAEHGLVRPAGAPAAAGGAWEAVATGLLVDLPDDAEGREAARLLTTQMFLEAAAIPQPWWHRDEPRLPEDWRRVAGLINARLWLTTDELQTLNALIEEHTASYAGRTEADRPAGTRRVRVQCYLMPEPA